MAQRVLAFILACAVVAYAQGNTFNKVRYNGGTVSTKVDPKDWDNQLSITSDLITFSLKDGQKIEIQPKSVTSLSYGQEAHRRFSDCSTRLACTSSAFNTTRPTASAPVC